MKDCKLLNREHAVASLRRISASRLDKRNTNDKEAHPHVICMSAPGTGKSRLAEYGFEALKEKDSDYPALSSLANNDASLAVHISYNSGTSFDDKDVNIGCEASLACRMLASYFRSMENSPLYSQLRSVSNIKSLTLEACVNVILEDHHRRLHLSPTSDFRTLLYVAIDDITSIYSYSALGLTHDIGKGFLKRLFDILSSLYSSKPYFFVSMVTGTILGPTSDVLNNTSRQYFNLPVPLLTLDQSMELARDAFSRADIPKVTMDKFDLQKFQLLLCDIGGIPRYVWNAIDSVLVNRLQYVDLAYLRWTIKTKISQRHAISKSSVDICLQIISAVVLRIPVNSTSQVLGVAEKVSWEDLENSGLVYFAHGTDLMLTSEVQVILPILHFECMMESHFSSPTNLIDSLVRMEWKSWEMFVASHDALLLILYRLQGRDMVRVSEYYKGAVVGSAVKDLTLNFPPVGYCKHTSTVETHFDPSIHAESIQITREVLSPRTPRLSSFLRVYISNRQRKLSPSKKAESLTDWPNDAVFVTYDQMEAFFSRTFADRIRLMLEYPQLFEGNASVVASMSNLGVEAGDSGDGDEQMSSKVARLV